ncbi:GTP cyclohydrolase II [Sphingomonas sp. LY160]|uniref:GTP cyclohydrolase II n=1 Tax=Sphingomonas sp. LY160 TaxID=3095342 RepID=UPI002ADEC07A|nr:GTP cyclohydrolase II [Sphingomonas sp. LY160]MEA1072426.1 GTP cyclohydrolase II [Sphingomonas sp. LY160]
MSDLARAIAALRLGRPVRVGALGILSAETASSEMLALADPEQRADLLISGERGAALGLGNMRESAGAAHPVRIERARWLDHGEASALIDPSRDFDRAPLGPLTVKAPPAEGAAALDLARLAGLLPALWLVDAAAGAPGVEVADVAASPKAVIVTRATLPLDGLPTSQMVAFRDPASGEEHVALVVGAFGGKPPLVRLHSECLTGDVFGSLKCDCGPQLKEALRIIGAEGGGVLLYLRQEGRGIGLTNKLRAYALQDRGLDTVDANRRLGFADDARDYRMAAAMLRALGVDSVRLLTNNPTKLAGLAREGFAVERVAHAMPANPHNADYLAAKRDRSGHLG